MPESHTATQQWQSFEMRMRLRRAERCALRASVALEAGVLADARDALDEALHLTPDDPLLHELAAQLEAAERQAALPVERPSRRWMGIAATLILCSAAGGWLWMQADAAVIGQFVARVDGVAARVAAAVRSIELPEIRIPLPTSTTNSPQPTSGEAAKPTAANDERPVSVSETSITVPDPEPATRSTAAGPDSPDGRRAPASNAAPPGAAEERRALRETPASQSPPVSARPAGNETASAPREVATAGAPASTAAPGGGPAAPPAQSTALQTREPPAAGAARTAIPSPEASNPPPAASARNAETTTARAGDTSAPAASGSALARAIDPANPRAREPANAEPATSRTPEPANPRSSESASPRASEPANPRPPGPADLAPLTTAPPAAVAAAPPVVPPPVATSGVPATAASAEGGVRATLSRYEAAYSGLDAAAASAVWPSVDRRALTRAFQDLDAQTVNLAKCDVKVNGTSAQADCTGSARWTPKVGSGTQTASRRWRFELRHTGGDWIITQATVR